MLGACSVSGLVMLDMAFVWGAEWNLVYDLHKLKGDNAIFDESGRHMKVRTELIGQATPRNKVMGCRIDNHTI